MEIKIGIHTLEVKPLAEIELDALTAWEKDVAQNATVYNNVGMRKAVLIGCLSAHYDILVNRLLGIEKSEAFRARLEAATTDEEVAAVLATK